MKYVTFKIGSRISYGVVQGQRVLDLAPLLGQRVPDLKSLITQDLHATAAELAARRNADFALSEVELLPVIPNPGKIVCVGLNYRDHVSEVQRDVTESPTLFLRVPSSQVGHGQDIILPPESDRLDYEGEVAIVIGTGGRRITQDRAWDHIAGYACYNEGSVRDWQTATPQWTAGKNFWRSGSFGPWMVSADEIAPGQVMTLVTRLNGTEMQRATTDLMIHSIPRQIAYISTFMPLEPGDVIVTGTPGGIGARRTPPVFMKAGDVVEVEVDTVGVLRNRVVAESVQALAGGAGV
ncbi:MAG TPA: fumarylacetoacetate hydrolase family protein [Ramlibacter sp.]|nr:fumarylacetoacetate hydrolase family protein [Ramlibacter sp.]